MLECLLIYRLTSGEKSVCPISERYMSSITGSLRDRAIEFVQREVSSLRLRTTEVLHVLRRVESRNRWRSLDPLRCEVSRGDVGEKVIGYSRYRSTAPQRD